MMKRFLLGFALCAISAPAWAACAVTNLQVKDNAAVTAAVPYADDGSGASNCSPQIQLKQGGNVAVVPAAGADTVSNATPGLQGFNFPFWFNGTTWDRARGDATNGAFVNVKTSVLPTGAGTAANQTTIHNDLVTLNATAGASVAAGANLIGNTGLVLPTGSTPIQATATGTTAATTATMAADATQFNFICGYSIRANATAAATGNATLTGLATSPLNFTQWTAPNASGLGVTEQIFVPCQPSSAINTAIAVVSAAPGTGGVVSVSVWGFKKVASP